LRTFTVRVDADAKERLERLAKSTGRSRSFLAAEAINQYLEVNEWQVAGIKPAPRNASSFASSRMLKHDFPITPRWVVPAGSREHANS
jgi:hypothetical protein